jgi:membrane protease YdiL (CAAX protease family)
MESPSAKSSSATWIGLFIALFGILLIRWAVSLYYPAFTFTGVIWKESLIWLCGVALLFIIWRGERLPLSSVNLGTAPIGKSTLWGIIIAVALALVGGIIASVTHFKGGPMGAAFGKLPFWLITLVVLRAGVVEELFYRGYAIERLQQLGLNRYWASAVPLLIFGFGHGANGCVNIILALALGAVLTIFYLWRRDLVANMIGHFLVDFIANILPRFFSHA